MCNNNKELMDPFASNGEDEDEEGGEHSKDKGEYTEEEILHIGEVAEANATLTNMPWNHITALAKTRGNPISHAGPRLECRGAE
jgi:hypothetical protein